MGIGQSWIAIKGKALDVILKEIDAKTTDEWEEVPESELSQVDLKNGWLAIINGDCDWTMKEDFLKRMSIGCELIACSVEEHVMVCMSAAWKNGEKLWSVTHDAQKSDDHLVSEGTLPAQYQKIYETNKQRQSNAKGVDYYFEIPVELANELTGYRHDVLLENLSEQPFQILEWTTTKQQKKPFWQRMLSK